MATLLTFFFLFVGFGLLLGLLFMRFILIPVEFVKRVVHNGSR